MFFFFSFPAAFVNKNTQTHPLEDKELYTNIKRNKFCAKENPLKENKTCHLLDKAMLRRVLDSSPSEYSLPHSHI